MVDRREYPCYHSVNQYSADGCGGCEYEMDCYNHFLNYMELYREKKRK